MNLRRTLVAHSRRPYERKTTSWGSSADLIASFGRIANADPIALATAIMALENSAGPDPDLLQPLLDRHGLSKCAADWLRCLDAAAADTPGDRRWLDERSARRSGTTTGA